MRIRWNRARLLLGAVAVATLFDVSCPAASMNADPLRVATFGTSLTARGGWQKPLEAALADCLRRPVEVRDFARSGAGSDWGASAVGPVAASRPDLVFLEFAVNDAALNKWLGVAASVRNMRTIVAAIRAANPAADIYIMAMSPVHGRRAWMRPWRRDYEDAHRELARELSLGYIDHLPSWNALGADAVVAAIPDGAHPDPKIATDIIVPNIVAGLRRDGLAKCFE